MNNPVFKSQVERLFEKIAIFSDPHAVAAATPDLQGQINRGLALERGLSDVASASGRLLQSGGGLAGRLLAGGGALGSGVLNAASNVVQRNPKAAIGTALLAPILSSAFSQSQQRQQEELMNAYSDPSRVITASLNAFLEKKAERYSMSKEAAAKSPPVPPALKKMMTDERRRSTRAISSAVARKVHGSGAIGDLGTSLLEGVGKGVGSTAGGVLVSLLAQAIGTGIGALHDKFSADPKRRALVDSVLKSDPVLSDAIKRHPESKRMVEESYSTMARFAPTLSLDINAVRSFLREAVMGGSGVNYATIKNLVDTEKSIAENKPRYGGK